MKNNDIYKSLAYLTQVGFNIFTPILLMTLLGVWIDKKLGTGHMALMICILLGVGAGILNILKLGKKL